MVQLAPWVFVLFWSTGFIVARYGTDDAGPLSFLAIRLAIAAVILAAVAAATGAPRPARLQLGWADQRNHEGQGGPLERQLVQTGHLAVAVQF